MEKDNLLSERLNKLIKEKEKIDGLKLTNAEIARVAKTSRASVTNWLKDANGISAPQARLLANYFNVDPLWIESGKGSALLEKKKEIEYKSNDEFERQLLYFYNGMTDGHKEALLELANKLYVIDNPLDKLANPYPKKPTKEKQ